MNSFADGIVEDVQERKLFKAAAKAASKQTKEAMKMKPTLGACLLCSASLAEGCTLDGTHWESLIPQESDVEFPSPGVTGISEAFGAVSQQGGAVFVSAGEHKTRGGCAIEVTSLGQGGSSNLVVVGRMAAKVCARWFLAGESRGSISNLALQARQTSFPSPTHTQKPLIQPTHPCRRRFPPSPRPNPSSTPPWSRLTAARAHVSGRMRPFPVTIRSRR